MKKINQMEPWIGQEEKNAVINYLDSGGWLTEYKKTEEFENIFKKYVGSKYATANVNGTLSLVAALLTLDLKNGEEVIVPNYTMISSANAVKFAGGEPVLVDIDPNNLCIDVSEAEKKISDNTRAIIYVSINGRSHHMANIESFARKNNIILLEDASQSLGSFYRGKHLGTFGEFGTFSFSTPKIITTGQGGMVVTDNFDYYNKLKMIKDYGRPKSGVDYYEILGYNFKFTDLQAVIGIEQMKKIHLRVERKKEMFKLYIDELEIIDNINFLKTDTQNTPPWFIDVLVDKKVRADLIIYLSTQGIGTRPFYPPINTQPPYKDVKGSFSNSLSISERGLWLPSSSFLSDEEIKYVCGKIHEYYRSR